MNFLYANNELSKDSLKTIKLIKFNKHIRFILDT